MAGTIIADKIQTENAFLTLNVGQTLVATINSSGILNSSGGTMIGANGSVSNTAISGVITGSQIANATISANNLTTSLNLATNNVQVASIQTATGTPAITFAANGQITTANAPFILTGGQIQFPATQIASGDGNCLDDYEEGSWTPTIKGASTAGTSTYAVQTGRYIKIGTLVFVTCYVTWNTANGTGNLRIGGLPFAGSNAGLYQGLALSGISGVSGSISGYVWFGRINNGESEISIKYANFATTTPNDGDIAVCNSGTLLFTGTYTI